MSDHIQHECGLAMIRLLKPLDFYLEKYGTALYGIHKMQLLMQKMRNRGQDGAGIATIKLDMPPGTRYISRKRSNDPAYLRHLFSNVFEHFDDLPEEKLRNPAWLKLNKPYTGELLMGHLRYGTHGYNSIETVHPFLRQNNYISRSLLMAGNFNLTNNDELFQELVELGQFPKEKSDTVLVLEKIGHFLDDEVQRLFNWFKAEGLNNIEINQQLFNHLDIQRILRRAARKFDGGFVWGGMIGFGDAFVLRDPNGIRPAYYYHDDEVVVMASERPAIMTAFDVRFKNIKEIGRGNALIIKHNGHIVEKNCIDPKEHKSCSFERIYFSRGNDKEIYDERKKLGKNLAHSILKSVDYDFKNTVFTFVPNTAESSFYGLIDELHKINDEKRAEKMEGKELSKSEIQELLAIRPRIEKLAIKDAKMRTFIADAATRHEMIGNVYDVTYGIVNNEKDTLVLIDDSIVRGTTLKNSIIRIVSRLFPKKVIVVSTAPQIRYPDCYGIDMSKMKNFAAFRALVSLLERDGKEYLLDETYERCKIENEKDRKEIKNAVQPLYDHYSYEEVSDQIAKILTPPDLNIPVQIIYQTLEGLHKSCPEHSGDWYFSGNYPTPGGNRVANTAFINYMEKKDVRAY